MSWYAQTEEAQKHMRECKGCENCIWIEEAAWAMTEHGTLIEKHQKEILIVKEPSKTEQNRIFNKEYKTPKKFNSFEEKITYIKQKFKGETIK